jgi:hypothetical protein
MISRRPVAGLLLAFISLAFVPGALADHAAPPVVRLIAPSSGTTVKLTGLAQDAPTFNWRVDYPTPPGRTVIVSLQVSTEPTVAIGPIANRSCDQANLACLTSFKAPADWFRHVDACVPTSRPPECATRQPGAPITFYWRVNVTWAGDHPEATASGSFKGSPTPIATVTASSTPATTAPRSPTATSATPTEAGSATPANATGRRRGCLSRRPLSHAAGGAGSSSTWATPGQASSR